jgi:hypothetical protein
MSAEPDPLARLREELAARGARARLTGPAGYRRLLVLPDSTSVPVDTVTLHPGGAYTYRKGAIPVHGPTFLWGPDEAHSAPASDPAAAAEQVIATMRPRPVGVVLRQLGDLQAGYQQQRTALLGDLAFLDPDLPDTIGRIADPVERAVAATRALAVEEAVLAIRDDAVRTLARPEQDGGLGVAQAEIGARLGYSRQLVYDILHRPQGGAEPAGPVDPTVTRLTAVNDPWLRAEAAGFALTTHRARKPALRRLQRAAVRRAIDGQHVTQADLARQLGTRPQTITRLLGPAGHPSRRRPARTRP